MVLILIGNSRSSIWLAVLLVSTSVFIHLLAAASNYTPLVIAD